MVCFCFVHIELHGYGRLQKKQTAFVKDRFSSDLQKFLDENEKFLDEFLPYG